MIRHRSATLSRLIQMPCEFNLSAAAGLLSGFVGSSLERALGAFHDLLDNTLLRELHSATSGL